MSVARGLTDLPASSRQPRDGALATVRVQNRLDSGHVARATRNIERPCPQTLVDGGATVQQAFQRGELVCVDRVNGGARLLSICCSCGRAR
jgi:hypothetical protein